MKGCSIVVSGAFFTVSIAGKSTAPQYSSWAVVCMEQLCAVKLLFRKQKAAPPLPATAATAPGTIEAPGTAQQLHHLPHSLQYLVSTEYLLSIYRVSTVSTVSTGQCSAGAGISWFLTVVVTGVASPAPRQLLPPPCRRLARALTLSLGSTIYWEMFIKGNISYE